MIVAFIFFIITLCAEELSTSFRLGTFKPYLKQASLLPVKMTECEIEMRSEINDFFSWWLNTNYVYAKTKTSLGDPLVFSIVPMSAGIKYEYVFFDICAPYAGIGLSATYGYLSEKSAIKQAVLHDWWYKLGYVLKFGVHLLVVEDITFDIFTDRYADFSRSSNAGWRTGAGMRFSFDTSEFRLV